MNQQVVAEGQKVRRLIPDTQVRQHLLPWAIGFALAAHFKIEKDDDVPSDLEFNQNIRPYLATQLSKLNEDMTFDIACAIKAAKACHTIRSRMFHQVPMAYAGGREFDFFALAFGLVNVVPVETYKCMQEHAVAMSDVYSSFLLLVRDLKATNYL